MFKKILISVISILCMIQFIVTFAEQNTEISEGTYIQLGRYMNEPIIWRCIDIDENGKLMLSDEILCYKAFDARNHIGVSVNSEQGGCGFWEESTLRTWLNATEEGGEIIWPGENPPTDENVIGPRYDNEDGFLSSNNFSNEEVSVVKTVSQWQILNVSNINKSTNGILFAFGYNYFPNRAYWFEQCGYTKVSELSHVEGGMYRLADSMFLLNESQVYNLWLNFGTIKANDTNCALSQTDLYGKFENSHRWWLRTGSDSCANIVYGVDDYSYAPVNNIIATGVRPAFYLNEDNMIIQSGSGTKEDPYIITGTASDSITVFSNGEQVNFNVAPITENDRTLVGMRAIFESLGADVNWEQETLTAKAVKDDTTIELQINNSVMMVNDEPVELDAPARLVNDNTMVPLRAISEALDADVEWIENLRRVVIDDPEPMVFDDNIGKENWQTGQFGNWIPDITKSDGGWYEYQQSLDKQ